MCRGDDRRDMRSATKVNTVAQIETIEDLKILFRFDNSLVTFDISFYPLCILIKHSNLIKIEQVLQFHIYLAALYFPGPFNILLIYSASKVKDCGRIWLPLE